MLPIVAGSIDGSKGGVAREWWQGRQRTRRPKDEAGSDRKTICEKNGPVATVVVWSVGTGRLN